MSTPTPRTDALVGELFELGAPDGRTTFGELMNFAEALERELSQARSEIGLYIKDREGVRAFAQRFIDAERAKVRTLHDACESICEEWGRNHDANPIGAGQRMATCASNALEKLEDAP